MKKYVMISVLCIQSGLLVASQNPASKAAAKVVSNRMSPKNPHKTEAMSIPASLKPVVDGHYRTSPGDILDYSCLDERNMSYSPGGEQSTSPRNHLRRKSEEKSWR